MLKSTEKKILEEEDPYGFEELFYKDLESWFSSDIACCDECYDDFLAHWPHAYSANKAAFQRSSIDLDCFYSGSRLQDSYTKEQFDKYLQLIPCPRCGSELKYNIWPYTLPFDVVENFEDKINEIAKISQKTPFLLLEHPFAKEVYKAIVDLSKESKPTTLENSLYRARTRSSLKNTNIREFDFPPNNIVSEGRYNHAGIPALYLCSDPETCFHELREKPCIIAKIKIADKVKVLDLTNTYDSHLKHSNLLATLVYSALMSARQDDFGWHKPKYVFSRFISDCAKSAGFDAIQYPSTRATNESYNIVILDNKFSLNDSSTLIELIPYENGQVGELKNT
ncbi:RES family NAD+ phosphorylase [Candidatus Pacearchaeota archaeon]|nr:RES family NAD+ phosphorylase [Candidatus Pacearchaeota archaeon]